MGLQISPRQGLLRVREFTLAEIEHFVDPDDKSHPKFAEVSKLEFLMFPREDQVSGRQARRIVIGEAVSQVDVTHFASYSLLSWMIFSLLTSTCRSCMPRVLSIMKHSDILLGEYTCSSPYLELIKTAYGSASIWQMRWHITLLIVGMLKLNALMDGLNVLVLLIDQHMIYMLIQYEFGKLLIYVGVFIF